ncbi:metalloregulator ArsR/SmtB family transcription factor [Streptosporangium sp. NPDC048047]|uniref:ArsR/SmtB family transcription factor n=1 Tax=Streptosporangium sp. NPDC048047 TaxID=3155748 RepID=UPI00341B1DFF
MATRGGRPRKEAGEPADRFAALADPTRRHLLERLAEREHAVNELVESLELSQAAVSQHLKVLREAGLVTVRAEGRHRRYGLDPAGFEPLRDWLDELERFWRARLRTLGDYLDRPGGAMNGSEGER